MTQIMVAVGAAAMDKNVWGRAASKYHVSSRREETDIVEEERGGGGGGGGGD